MECSKKTCFGELKEQMPRLSKQCNNNCLKSFDNRRHISISENRKKYLLHNDVADFIAVFHVDGGMIQSHEIIKCDNLVLDATSMKAIFVELKGTNLAHALEQVNTTIDMLSSDVTEYSLFARIVTSNRTNVPNIRTNSNYIRLYKKANVKIMSNILEESVSSLS